MQAVTHRQSFLPHPLALLAVSFAAGVLLAHVFALPLAICFACGASVSLLAVFTLVWRKLGLASLLICLAFVCVGATLATIEKESIADNRVRRFYEEGRIASGEPVEITGALERAPEYAPDGFNILLRVERLRFKADEHAVSGTVQLFAPVRDETARIEYAALELRRGARVRMMIRLERAEKFRNPGVSSRTEFLERRGFDAVGSIKSPLLVERLDDERVFLPLVCLEKWRGHLLTKMDQLFSVETSGVLKASLLGNRYGLSHATAERFREGGTYHVIVISGAHISFIGGLVLVLARLVTRRRAWQFAMSVIFLWAYAIAVGAEAAVVRAALMFTVVILAPVLSRRITTLNALGGATIALLVWRPSNLFDPSFQLTFLCVLVIVTLSWPLLENLRAVGAWWPTQKTPYPPSCPRWWRTLGETLFWSEERWRREMMHQTHSYRLFKTPVAARLERWRVQRPLRYTFGVLIVSASMQLGLLPLQVLYFHRLSFASFILNIFVGVLIAALSLIALAALVVSSLSTVFAVPLVWLAEKINWLMIHSVDPFARAHMASVRLPEYTGFSAAVYVLYYVPLIVLAVALVRWNPLSLPQASHNNRRDTWYLALKLAAVALVAMLVIIVVHPLSAGRLDGRLRVDFLDVGQGDAALVTMPDGTTLLIDGGGRPSYDTRRNSDEAEAAKPFERDTRSIGEAVVSEYLWWRGLDHIDYILATHADADHIDGLNDIARNFKVRAALVGRAPLTDTEYARFAATMQKYGVPLYHIGRGDSLRFGAVVADVLWPLHTEDRNALSGNDDSVVLRLRFNQRTFLLTGDIERNAEGALISVPEELRCDVVKVPHHGSNTSSTEPFVTATRPSFAVISVGLKSPFRHPHKEVVERWQASGAEVLTTGRCGTITISTDGSDLKVKTFAPSCEPYAPPLASATH